MVKHLELTIAKETQNKVVFADEADDAPVSTLYVTKTALDELLKDAGLQDVGDHKLHLTLELA
jgi:hypothetical protein